MRIADVATRRSFASAPTRAAYYFPRRAPPRTSAADGPHENIWLLRSFHPIAKGW